MRWWLHHIRQTFLRTHTYTHTFFFFIRSPPLPSLAAWQRYKPELHRTTLCGGASGTSAHMHKYRPYWFTDSDVKNTSLNRCKRSLKGRIAVKNALRYILFSKGTSMYIGGVCVHLHQVSHLDHIVAIDAAASSVGKQSLCFRSPVKCL